MSADTPTKIWEELRKPFDPKVIGKIPKGGVQLDYVGHAAVTDRLNTVVGPENWSLEPIAFDSWGNPVVNERGELWCRLTILGASKLCVGDGSTSAKQLIGDALRNGAMRFGVALDLWSKEELESHLDHPELKNEKPALAPSKVTPATMAILKKKMVEKQIGGENATNFAVSIIGTPQPASDKDAFTLIAALDKL